MMVNHHSLVNPIKITKFRHSWWRALEPMEHRCYVAGTVGMPLWVTRPVGLAYDVTMLGLMEVYGIRTYEITIKHIKTRYFEINTSIAKITIWCEQKGTGVHNRQTSNHFKTPVQDVQGKHLPRRTILWTKRICGDHSLPAAGWMFLEEWGGDSFHKGVGFF